MRSDKDADPWDEAEWYKANPALGDFLSIEELRETAKQAQKLPASRRPFGICISISGLRQRTIFCHLTCGN